MEKFSQRMGFQNVNTVIQIDSMEVGLIAEPGSLTCVMRYAMDPGENASESERIIPQRRRT